MEPMTIDYDTKVRAAAQTFGEHVKESIFQLSQKGTIRRERVGDRRYFRYLLEHELFGSTIRMCRANGITRRMLMDEVQVLVTTFNRLAYYLIIDPDDLREAIRRRRPNERIRNAI